MSFLSRARFMGRALSRRSGWDTLARSIPAAKQAEFNAGVAALNKRKEKALAASEDKHIDFDAYAEILGKSEVDAIRKEYEAYQYSDFEAEKEQELAELKSQLKTVLVEIEKFEADMSQAAQDASAELAELQRTRTTLETSLDDVIRRHPDIYAELQENLENENWDTEAKPIDIDAMRLSAIQENWDAETLGPLDENSQKEFMDEIQALEQRSAESTANDMPEHFQQYINEWHEILGRTPDPVSLQAFIDANKVTDADRAIKDERILFHEISMAAELSQFERTKGLIEHVEELQASGELVTDEQWRASEAKKLVTAHATGQFNILPTEEMLSGKTSEELEAMADEAAEKSDFFKATHLLYAARVQSGDIDTSETSLNTFSGVANHFVERSRNLLESR